MQEVIVRSRITPKKGLKNVISRAALTAEIRKNIDKSLVLVCAPAGYGKTTLVQQYLEKQDTPYFWFHITPDVNNLYTFVLYIVQAARTINADFGENTLEAIDSLRQSMNLATDLKSIVPILAGTFSNDIATSFGSDILMVLDDLHEVQSENWFAPFFDALFESIPSELHIIATTREIPAFGLSKLVSKRNAVTIDFKKLKFSSEEIGELLREVYSLPFTDKDTKLLEKKLNGWITGIHLVLQAQGGKFTSADLKTADVFSFFTNDIFASLDDEQREFLLNTCYLDSFDAETCDRLFGITNSRSIIDKLISKNIFIESISESDDSKQAKSSYRYHKMFKDFLADKLHEIRTEPEFKATLKKISEYYVDTGNAPAAAGFSIFAGDYETAIGIIKQSFVRIFEDNGYEMLWKWFEDIPSDLTGGDPQLVYFIGLLNRFYKSDYGNSLKLFETARCLSEPRSALLVDTSLQAAEVLLRLNRQTESLKMLEGLINEETDPLDSAKTLYTEASIYYRMGPEYYDKVTEAVDKGISVCEENKLTDFVINFYKLSGQVFTHKGDLIKSIYYYELILKQEHSVISRIQTLYNIISLYAWSGNYSKAKEYSDEASAIYEQFPSVYLKRFMLRTKALLYFETGDYESAVEQLNEVIDIGIRNKQTHFLFWHYLFIGECYVLWGKIEPARKYYEIAESHIDKNDTNALQSLNTNKAILDKNTVCSKEAETMLLDSLKYFEANGLVYANTQVKFHLADYYYKTGMTDSAMQYLKESLTTASEKQYISFLEQSYLSSRYLFDAAISANISKEFARQVLASVLNKASIEWLSDEFKSRMKKITPSLYDIHLSAFGGIELMVRGKTVPEDKWIRKKSKLILAYLLLNQEYKFTKDKIFGIFFTDLSAASADNVFHQSITNIRSALKPDDDAVKPKGTGKKASAAKKDKLPDSSPDYIIYEDKILRLNPNYYYKVDAVEFNELYHKIKSAETSQSKKEEYGLRALELYKGELLAGQYDEWCEELRTNYANKFSDLCEEMITMFKEKNKNHEVIKYASRLIDSDKLHADAYLDIIEAYVKEGNFNSARTKFSQLLKNYDEEYGEKPPKAILNRIQELLSAD